MKKIEDNASQIPNPAQEKVAKTVSTIVLAGTCVLGALGMSIAIVAISKGSIRQSKEILQILFSAILPLFGTWIGTILAYYFSKENLLAANQTVRHLVDNITSDKKLQSIKAIDVMIPLKSFKYISYKNESEDESINLKTDFLDYLNKEGIQRIILLDENKCAKYVLHRSTIEGFIADQYFHLQSAGDPPADPRASPPENLPIPATKTPQTLTFTDFKTKGDANVQAVLKDGVKFIKEDANLSDAKVLIKNYTPCNDVFITKSGLANEPVLGWITDKTISENSIV
jgi:hypothetical protein